MLYLFKTFLPIAEKVYDRKTTLDILHNISVRDDFLQMTDLEIFVRMPIKSKQNYTLPVKILKKILSTKPATLDIKILEDGKVNIIFEDRSIIVPTTNTDDYPLFPKGNFSKIAEWSREVFHQFAKQINFASGDLLRPALNGVLVKQDGSFSSAATDGHILQWIKNLDAKGKCLHFKEYECIIPARILKFIAKYVPYKTEVWQSEEHLSFKLGRDLEFTVRTISGPYVDYRKVIPADLPNTLFVNKKKLLEQIKSAKPFSSLAHDIILKANNGVIEFNAQDMDMGTEYHSRLKVEKREGDELDVTLNLDLLERIVTGMDGEMVQWKYTDADSPNILSCKENENILNLLMPIRRKEA